MDEKVDPSGSKTAIADLTTPMDLDQRLLSVNYKLVISKWNKNLTTGEIYRIHEHVKDVYSAFFSDEEWNF